MKNDQQTVTVIIPSQKGFEKTVLSIAQCLAQEVGLSEKKANHLKIALAEACMNAIEHGNQSQAELDVTVKFILHPAKLEVIVQDSGLSGSITAPTETPNIDAKVAGQESARGWGLFLIRKFVDEFEIDTSSDKGNRIRLTLNLAPTPQHDNTDS